MESWKAWAIGGLVVLFIGIATPALIKWRWEMRAVSEEGRRTTFEETKSYNEGKEQELLRLYREYMSASDEEKASLAFVIRHQFADYDASKLDIELQNFLEEIKYGGK